MMSSKTFQCEACGKQVELAGATKSPPLRIAAGLSGLRWIACRPEMPATAEHSRFDAEDDPCDDGRAG